MKKFAVAFFFICAITQSSFAGDPAGGTARGATPTPAAPTLPSMATASTSIQAQAKEAQGLHWGEVAQAGVAVAGAGYMAYTSCPVCYSAIGFAACGACVMGILGVVMGVKAGYEACTVARGADASFAQVSNGPTPPPGGPNNQAGKFQDTVNKTVAELGKIGIKVDAKRGVATTPDGRTFDSNAIAKGDFSGTGMTPEQVASAKTQLAKMMEENGKATVASTDGADAAEMPNFNFGAEPSAAADGAESGAQGNRLGRASPSRQVAASTGMKRVLDNGRDAIGVSSDSLFSMVSNRYREQGHSGKFGF